MANGQPRPVFYVAVLLVVIGLVGLALWRYGQIGPVRPGDQISTEELKQMKGGAEAPDSAGITTVKEYKYVPAAKLPAVKGISTYKPMADRTLRFAINVWAGWSPIIFANNGFKPGKVWKTSGGKDSTGTAAPASPTSRRRSYRNSWPALPETRRKAICETAITA